MVLTTTQTPKSPIAAPFKRPAEARHLKDLPST